MGIPCQKNGVLCIKNKPLCTTPKGAFFIKKEHGTPQKMNTPHPKMDMNHDENNAENAFQESKIHG